MPRGNHIKKRNMIDLSVCAVLCRCEQLLRKADILIDRLDNDSNVREE